MANTVSTRPAAGRRTWGQLVATREYTSLTTYLNDAGRLVVLDAHGVLRDSPVNVTDELARLRGLGWQLVDVDTSEAAIDHGSSQTVVMTSYLLERRPA